MFIIKKPIAIKVKGRRLTSPQSLKREIFNITNDISDNKAKRFDVQLTGSSIIFSKGTDYLLKHLFESIGLAIVSKEVQIKPASDSLSRLEKML